MTCLFLESNIELSVSYFFLSWSRLYFNKLKSWSHVLLDYWSSVFLVLFSKTVFIFSIASSSTSTQCFCSCYFNKWDTELNSLPCSFNFSFRLWFSWSCSFSILLKFTPVVWITGSNFCDFYFYCCSSFSNLIILNSNS